MSRLPRHRDHRDIGIIDRAREGAASRQLVVALAEALQAQGKADAFLRGLVNALFYCRNGTRTRVLVAPRRMVPLATISAGC